MHAPLPIDHKTKPANSEPVAHQDRAEDAEEGAGDDIAWVMSGDHHTAYRNQQGIYPHNRAGSRPERADRNGRSEGGRAVARGDAGVLRLPDERHKHKRAAVLDHEGARAADNPFENSNKQTGYSDREEQESKPDRECSQYQPCDARQFP